MIFYVICLVTKLFNQRRMVRNSQVSIAHKDKGNFWNFFDAKSGNPVITHFLQKVSSKLVKGWKIIEISEK